MPKKTAFVMYMDARRPEFGGVTGGYRELAQLCAADWAALPETEKRKFAEEAKWYNENGANQKASNGPSKAETASTAAPMNDGDGSESMIVDLPINRCIVKDIFARSDWMTQPIVICSFNLYVEPGLSLLYMPAEIGLTAMNLKNGVIDNYARIIDPGAVPKGYGIEVMHRAEQLGLPEIDKFKEFSNYNSLMMVIESFLQQHMGNLSKDGLYVFAFQSDHYVITRCFEWLFDKTNIRLPIKILSLEYFAYMACVKSGEIPRGSNVQSGPPIRHKNKIGATLADTTVSSYRKLGQSLVGTFIYASAYPTCAYGLFLAEEEVEKVIKDVDNYKYYEELGCVYHIKNGKAVQNCALNMSNRYAFSILEILTLSLEVPVIAGSHYPEIDKPMIEKKRRIQMLEKWGITTLELEMEEHKYEEEIVEREMRGGRFRLLRGDLNGRGGSSRGRGRDGFIGRGRDGSIGHGRDGSIGRGRGGWDGDGSSRGRDRRQGPGGPSRPREVLFARPDVNMPEDTVTAEIDFGEHQMGIEDEELEFPQNGNYDGNSHPFQGTVPPIFQWSK